MMRKLLFILLAVLFVGTPVLAKGKKAPKSQLKSFSYHMGGGMSIEQQDEVYLRLTADGKRLLTLRGSCYYERLTFEVGEEVFLRCDSIIHTTKLYESKGYYEYEVRLLDAPSSGFDVMYADSKENFSGSGDMPNEIWDGMRAVINYLKSLRGGREAKGHLRTTYRLDSNELIRNTEWADGYISYLPEEDLTEIFQFLSRSYGFDYFPSEWMLRYTEGSGQRSIIAINQRQEIFDVFVDKNTLGSLLPDTDNLPGLWPQTSQRLLTKADLAGIPSDSLSLMADEIYARHQCRVRNDDHEAYFRTQSWYKPSWKYDNEDVTDVERQNFELIQMLINRRQLEARQAK